MTSLTMRHSLWLHGDCTCTAVAAFVAILLLPLLLQQLGTTAVLHLLGAHLLHEVKP
jgi:hypothetical protein